MIPTPDSSPLFVNALARGISVLRAFKEGHGWMSLQELANETGLTKSAIQRFTHTLWVMGYLRKDPDTRKFSLGPQAIEFGCEYTTSNPFVSTGNTYLHALNRATGETCSLSEPTGKDVIYVARFAAHKEMFVQMPIGMRLPAYCTAAGRAILANIDPAVARTIIEKSERHAHTATTITDLEALLRELEQVKRSGYSLSNGEYYAGDLTVSAAVFNSDRLPIGAINVSVPVSRWSLTEVQTKLAPQVVEAARALSTLNLNHIKHPFYLFESDALV